MGGGGGGGGGWVVVVVAVAAVVVAAAAAAWWWWRKPRRWRRQRRSCAGCGGGEPRVGLGWVGLDGLTECGSRIRHGGWWGGGGQLFPDNFRKDGPSLKSAMLASIPREAGGPVAQCGGVFMALWCGTCVTYLLCGRGSAWHTQHSGIGVQNARTIVSTISY